ncbi:hypothetical protein HUJ05_008292 [Dendroctonus ponderosae]|nr:hypothetical protein HUJ05_008292 [Dendroctonus ponderosae]
MPGVWIQSAPTHHSMPTFKCHRTSITDRSPENLEKYESVDRCLENPITEILDGGEKNKSRAWISQSVSI